MATKLAASDSLAFVDLSLDTLSAKFQEFGAGVEKQLQAETVEAQAQAGQEAIVLAGKALTEGDKAELTQRRDALVELLNAVEARAKRIRKTVQQAEKLARHYESFQKGMEGSIELFMIEKDLTRIEGDLHRFAIYKAPDRLQITDETQIPPEFFDDVPATKELNKDRLKTVLEAGVEVPGAFLETNRKRLDIK